MTFIETIGHNKAQAEKYITPLWQQLKKERNKFFSSSSLIQSIDSDIYKFEELIKASDKLSLAFSNATFAITETNKLGQLISSTIYQQNNSIGYGLDDRFKILYQLLDNKIHKREEFIQCINQYNDIVLGFLYFKQDSYYANLNLKTIDVLPQPSDFKNIGVINQPKYNNQLASSGSQYIGLRNETPLYLSYALFHRTKNDELKYEKSSQINAGQSISINFSRMYYDLLISDPAKKVENCMKTAKSGYNFKIVLNQYKKKLYIVSGD